MTMFSRSLRRDSCRRRCDVLETLLQTKRSLSLSVSCFQRRNDDETAGDLEWMAEEDEDENRERRGVEEWSFNPMAVDQDEDSREEAEVLDGLQEEEDEDGDDEVGVAVYDDPPSSPIVPSPEKGLELLAGRSPGTPTRGAGRRADVGGAPFPSTWVLLMSEFLFVSC